MRDEQKQTPQDIRGEAKSKPIVSSRSRCYRRPRCQRFIHMACFQGQNKVYGYHTDLISIILLSYVIIFS